MKKEVILRFPEVEWPP